MKAINSLESFLYWMGGTAEELIVQCKPWVQRVYLTLGMVFLANLVLLLAAWLKVGIHYFGWFGMLPGIIIPAVFVLGIDRIIAMRPRPLAGDLQRYNISSGELAWEIGLRILISATLSVTSTFTLQLNLSHDLIREVAQAEATRANADLRQEYVDAAHRLATPESAALDARESALQDQRLRVQQELEQAIAEETKASAAAKSARREQHAEAGGLDQRPSGKGRRYEAQREIADMFEAAALDARHARQQAEARVGSLDSELSTIRAAVVEVNRQHTAQLESINSAIVEDARYVPEKSDMFSDAVVFMGLFSDPQRARGVLFMTTLTFLVLMVLELCSVLVLFLLPQTEYDVAKNSSVVKEAARMASIPGLEDLNADLRAYQAFSDSEGGDDSFAIAVREMEQKFLQARLEVLNGELRGRQAQSLGTLDVRLPGLATVEVQPSANSEMPPVGLAGARRDESPEAV